MFKCNFKTRIIRVICLCIIFSIAFCSFAFGSTYEEYDQDGNYIGPTNTIGSANNTNYLLSKISYHIQRVRTSIDNLGVELISANQHLSNIYNSLDDIYTRLGSAVDYLQYIYNNTSTANTHLNNISSYVNTIRSNSNTDLTLQASQLTQLQQINNKLDSINSIKWTNTYTSYSGLSSDNINFDNSNGIYVGADTVYCRIYGDYRLTSDTIFHVVLPVQISSPIYLQSINILFNNALNNDVNIIYYKCNTIQTDIYFTVNRSSYFLYLTFQFNFNRVSRIVNCSNDISVSLQYLLESDSNYYDVLNTLADLYYLDQISNKLDNIEVSVDTSDIVDAINGLDITQDMDIDISQDVTQTTNLITQLRNLFGTGVSIPQFVQQTQDQSLLGWFSQSNSDNINHISTGYNEAPY